MRILIKKLFGLGCSKPVRHVRDSLEKSIFPLTTLLFTYGKYLIIFSWSFLKGILILRLLVDSNLDPTTFPAKKYRKKKHVEWDNSFIPRSPTSGVWFYGKDARCKSWHGLGLPDSPMETLRFSLSSHVLISAQQHCFSIPCCCLPYGLV